MRRFFWVRADVNHYKIFLPDVDPRISLETRLLLCACKPIGEKFYLRAKHQYSSQSDSDRRAPFGDFPELSGAVAMSPRAVLAMRDIIARDAEVLPLAGQCEGWQVLNITTKLDALDRERADYKADDTGHVYWVDKVVLRRGALNDHNVFRIMIGPTWFFVSDRFVERYNEQGLEGLIFKEVEVTG